MNFSRAEWSISDVEKYCSKLSLVLTSFLNLNYLLNIISQHHIDKNIKDNITSITTASALKKSSKSEKSFD